MNYQLNPLLELYESFSKVWKRAQNLSPEVAKRYMQHYGLARFGNGSQSTLTAANNYGSRLIKGQIKRAHNLAKQSGRNVKIIKVDDPLLSKVTTNNFLKDPSVFPNLTKKAQYHVKKGKDIITLAGDNQKLNDSLRRSLIDNPEILHRNIKQTFPPALKDVLSKPDELVNKNKGMIKRASKKMNKALANTNISSPNLVAGHMAAHEIDEYESALKLARKYNTTPENIMNIQAFRLAAAKGAPGGTHLPGVLKKEYDRAHKLSMMFDRQPGMNLGRSRAEYSFNQKPFVYSLSNSI